ncbi:MAG: hypothetical protein SPE66_03465 [Bilifractor sp.]|jgi:uncharacterized MnhB-related membrane protein|nr:hypothetical protein [Bilifractor sp.]
MSEERWISTLKTVLIILAVIVVVLVITHTDEIGTWIARNLMSKTHSNLQQILE